MLTRLRIRNFKLFDDVELELGERVVLIGPNNAGKTTALQALALWDIGVKRWIEKRGTGDAPGKRTGAAVNRRDLTAVPVPAAWNSITRMKNRSAAGPFAPPGISPGRFPRRPPKFERRICPR